MLIECDVVTLPVNLLDEILICALMQKFDTGIRDILGVDKRESVFSAFYLAMDRLCSHFLDPHDVGPKSAGAIVGPDNVWEPKANERKT